MKILSFYSLILTLAFILLFFSSSRKSDGDAGEKSPPSELQSDNLAQVIQSPHINEGVNLGGELVPLANFDAKERLERELMVNCYWHSSTLMFLKYANRYFPVIEPILAKNGVPDDFKFLAVAESALRNGTSPAGAKGIWQFMPATAKGHGLTVNSEIDERYHLEKATEAACEYLKSSKKRFGSWTLAAASYNMGSSKLSNVMEEQKEKDYYNLNLNDETARYVFRIIAIKEIMKSPREYGFYLDSQDLYPAINDYSLVQVDGPIDSWGDFAHQYGTNYRMLKVYNPWLLDSGLANREKAVYEIKIPK